MLAVALSHGDYRRVATRVAYAEQRPYHFIQVLYNSRAIRDARRTVGVESLHGDI